MNNLHLACHARVVFDYALRGSYLARVRTFALVVHILRGWNQHSWNSPDGDVALKFFRRYKRSD